MQTLEVVTLGDVPRPLVDAIAAAPAASFGLAVRHRPALAEPRYAFNPDRGQHHGAAILRKIAAGKRADAIVLGVGMFDLFLPDAAFVLGEHDRDLLTAVVGLRRLLPGPSNDVTLRRAGALGLWAVGRAGGLPECEDGRCPLSHPETPESLDRRLAFLCPRCQAARATARERAG